MNSLENFINNMLNNQQLRSGNTVSPEQLGIMQEFNSYLTEKNVSLNTKKNYFQVLRKVSITIGKPLDKSVTKEGIEVWLNSIREDAVQTKISKIATVKKYFKWVYFRGTSDMKKNIYPGIVDWIEMPNNKVEKKITSADLLSQEDIKKMMDSCDNARDKAIVSLLFDSGLRKTELVNLNIGDIHIDINEQYLTVRNEQGNKTGARDVPLNYSIAAIKEWINVHPFKDQLDKPLFICLEHGSGKQTCRYGERISGCSVLRIVKLSGKDAKINKRIFAHLFRHSRNTDLEDKGAPRSARICMFGWTEKSRMPEHYSHLSKEQNISKIRQADGLIPKIPQMVDVLKPILCPRCKEQNSPVNRFCSRCATPLDEKNIQRILMQTIVETAIENLFNKKPELQELAKQEMMSDPILKEKLLMIKNPEIRGLLEKED